MSGIKSDRWIRSQCIPSHLQLKRADGGSFKPMIEPFESGQVRVKKPYSAEFDTDLLLNRGKIISYGTSSYGYDVRCAPEFKIFTNINSAIVDPKNFDERAFVGFSGDRCIIPPNSFILARSVEYLRIPRDVLVVCVGKSTYARVGIVCNVTPLEPEWEGHITLEFSNTTNLPAVMYANEGCAQLLFFQADSNDICETSYLDRGGKYQGQTGVTLPRT
jgi:dCTP deaminase